MKRLITFLLSAIVIINFSMAQTPAPMAVVGDVYVKNGGTMLSKGTVHVKTGRDSIRGLIDNYGSLKFQRGIIFYSNDSVDGLLRNMNSGNNAISVDSVIVRKAFANTQVSYGNWYFYTFSFPFKVGMKAKRQNGTYLPRSYSGSCILDSTGKELALWEDYWVAYYDSQRRVISGKNEGNWQDIDEDSINCLSKGEGYRIWSKSTPVINFKLTDPSEITALFNYNDKKTGVTYYHDPTKVSYNGPSEGWNILGGLSTCSFLLDSANIRYAKGTTSIIDSSLIHFWKNTGGGNGEWTFIYPLAGESAVLSPYVTFYVQTNDNNLQFNFRNTGLTLKKADPIGFRVAEESSNTNDMMQLNLTAFSDKSRTDRIFLEFNDGYSEQFKVFEDGPTQVNTGELERPQLWSWNSSTQMSLDRLPYIKKREIKLGGTLPKAAPYIVDLDVKQKKLLKSAILKDMDIKVDPKGNVKEWNLLTGQYKFDGSKGDLNRFVLVLEFETTNTSIDPPAIDGMVVYAYTNDNVLTVKNLQTGDQIKVLDLGGRVITSGIASSDEFSTGLNQKGVYIVNVKGEKTTVLKVLNK